VGFGHDDGFQGNAFASSGAPPPPPPPPANPYANPDFNATGAAPAYIFPGSIWAQKLPASPTVKVGSASLVTNLLTQGENAGGNPSLFSVAGLDGTSRYVLHGNAVTPITMEVNPLGQWNGPTGTLQAPIPTKATPSPGSDHTLGIWNVDNSTIGSYTGPVNYSFWNTYSTAPWICLVEMLQPTDGSYYGFGGWSQDSLKTGTARASGCPFLADTVTYAEWLNGTIPHVLGLTIANPTTQYVSPATASDGTASIAGGAVPYGELFALPANTAEPNWATTGCSSPLFAHMVFVALKTYGMFTVDQTVGNGCGIAAEGFNPWHAYNPNIHGTGLDWPLDLALAYNALKGMPWSSLEVVVPSLLLGSGGGGSSSVPASGTATGTATTSPANIVLPSTINAGDTLLLFVTLAGQSFASGAPSGWSLLGFIAAAGTCAAVYTKTAAGGDSGSTIHINFLGGAILWDVVDVQNSGGATFSEGYQGFANFTTGPATLTGTQGLTLMYATVGGNGMVSEWSDGYTQLQSLWTDTSPWSGGVGVFTGPAYGDGMAFNTFETCLGLQVAV
jgi:hypothetical protein